MTKVGTLEAGDAERAIATLTLAFATDPVMRSFHPESREHLAHFAENIGERRLNRGIASSV